MTTPKFLFREEVLARLRVRPSTLYAMCADGRFPKPFKLTPKRTAWREDVVDAWLRDKMAEVA